MLRFSLLFLTLFCAVLSFGQKSLWDDVSEPAVNDRQITPSEYRTLSINFEALKSELLQAPAEKTVSVINSDFLFEIPAPDGTSWTFRIVQSSIMAPELQDRFPEIRTFLGQGTGDHGHATLRMDFTPKGFHAQVLAAGESFYIDPYAPGITDIYICYSREAFYQQNTKTMPTCSPQSPGPEIHEQPDHEKGDGEKGKGGPNVLEKTINGTQLRVYDLALACTGEYAQFHGGTVAGALAAMVTSMNRVNGIFERDLSLRMVIIGNNDQIIFLDGSTDPYSNGDGFAMLNQNQTTCDNIIGSANYDIGHVFSTGGGGVASLQSPCSSSKARGVTGQGSPVGDPFDVDYVAHEMGHQWGARHTQNNNCNRSTSAAFEPGSASTIMGYAGICPPNLQSNSDDHFHNHSFNEMYNFSVNGNGDNCATTNATGNTPPSVVVPAGGFFIPISTPFELTANGSDPDPDVLTYCWEQYDLGPATAPGDNDLTNPSGNQPIFRSWSPTTNPTRVFPRLSDLVNNTTVIGELLPTYSRDLTFRCTVRDNRANGGGVIDDQVAFESTASAGPFLVSAPNTAVTWTANTSQTVTWDVANTDATPVNCSNVDIFLSEDGGFTFPYTLATNVANDGSQVVNVPNINTAQARVKVKAANNIFFDISNQNFTINPASCSGTPAISSIVPNSGDCAGGVSVTLTGTNFCDPTTVSHAGISATITAASETEIVYTAPSGSGSVGVEVTTPFGTSNSVQFTYNAPVIASVTPTALECAGGSLLTLTGSNFCDASSVTVGGSSATDLIVSPSQIVATAPAGSGSNVAVVVTTPSGISNSVTVNYQAPLIASVSPTSLECAGGSLLTLSGSNFCDANSVTVGGASAPNVTVLSANTITATAPAGSGSNVAVVVTTPSGISNSVTVDYQAPLIASLTPSALGCEGGALLTISGSNFCDANSVTVGGASAPNVTVLSANTITATAPAGSGTNVPVVVTTPSGSSNIATVNYQAPLIASVAPSSLECAGGSALTILGSNFCDASSVTIDGNSASIVSQDASFLWVTAPAGSGTNVPVVVTTPSGSSNIATVNYQAPLIASVTPSALACEGGALLTISGSNFCDANSVTVGGASAPNVTVLSANTITATAPAGSGTNVPVVVTTPSGTSNSFPVDYQPPVISSVSPSPLPCAGGATLTVIGANLCNAQEVTVDGNPATGLIQISSTEIQVTSPSGSGTGVPLIVTTPSGSSNSFSVDFDVCPSTCDPGFYDDNGTCTECPPGTFCPGDGNSYPCAAGEFSAVSGAESCEPCTAGTYNPAIGATSCQPCEAGSFSNVVGATSCTDCPEGTSQGLQGQTECVLCPAGTFSAITGATECTDCSSGTYQDQLGSTDCIDCPAGSSSDPGATSCDICDPGYYDDNGTCTECPPGTFCPGDGNSYPCPVGQFSAVTGAESCEPCLAGFYNPNVGATSCLPCEAGSFSNIVGASSCTDCPAGTSQGLQAQTSCDLCPPGTFSAIEGATECTDCSSDTYQDQFGSVECFDCPAGTTSDPGATSCDPCSFQVVGSSQPATPGFANGSASVTVSGGVSPYTYLWNDPFMQTDPTAVGLFPGTYMCTITDANDCVETITVAVSLMVDVPATQINSTYCNTGGYELSDFIACNPVQNAGAYRWEFTPQGGSPLPEYTRADGNQWVRLQWINGMAVGTTYDVRVKANVNGEWGEYGSVCTIATAADVPLTEVRPQYHPTNSSGANYNLCDFIIAYSVPNATNYRWRFDPDTDPNNGNEIFYTRGSGNTATRLSWVNGLTPASTYEVAVQAAIGASWGNFGAVHSVILAQPPAPVLRASFCNQSYPENGYVLATSVCDADLYQFEFEPLGGGPVSIINAGNYVAFFNNASPSLAPGDYNVRVRVSQAGVLGNYGASCPISILAPGSFTEDTNSMIAYKSLNNQSEVSFFPNPNDGNAVRMTAENLKDEFHSVQILVSDMYGKTLQSSAFTAEGRIVSRLIFFERPLNTGVYMIQVIVDGSVQRTERMVISR